jgi:hypothetical protein
VTDRLTTSFLRQVHAAATRAHEMPGRLTHAMRDRYGVTHSDVDCDTLIDALDYGVSGPAPTLAECDAEMARCGARPIRAALNNRRNA